MISSAAWACIERDKRILQNTISSTERGSMIAWLEMHCYWPVPNWADDEDVKRLFWKCSDGRGGFVKAELVTVTAAAEKVLGQLGPCENVALTAKDLPEITSSRLPSDQLGGDRG